MASNEKELLESAPERIAARRMGEAMVRVVDAQGQPAAGARVRVEQVRHAFLFGCNVFSVLGYQDPEQEATYEREFAALFNYATLGFYWGSYERAQGKTLAPHLERQARWCREHGIATKGHPLVWHEVYPKWAPSDAEETRELSRARVGHIVSRFQGLVDRWDVVNEATVSHNFDNGVGAWAKRDGACKLVCDALNWANAANPEAMLLYNDYNLGPEFVQLVKDLLAAGCPVHAIGLQSHMHRSEWSLSKAWETCEMFAPFGLPLHFTELTVLSGEHGWMREKPWPTTPEGEARQEAYVAALYTLLFSHPALEAITWWDLTDGSWQGAPAGLVRADLTPKPAYERLLSLVKGEWWTQTEVTTDASGEARFRGFLGDYRITTAGKSADLTLTREAENAVTVQV